MNTELEKRLKNDKGYKIFNEGLALGYWHCIEDVVIGSGIPMKEAKELMNNKLDAMKLNKKVFWQRVEIVQELADEHKWENDN